MSFPVFLEGTVKILPNQEKPTHSRGRMPRTVSARLLEIGRSWQWSSWTSSWCRWQWRCRRIETTMDIFLSSWSKVLSYACCKWDEVGSQANYDCPGVDGCCGAVVRVPGVGAVLTGHRTRTRLRVWTIYCKTEGFLLTFTIPTFPILNTKRARMQLRSAWRPRVFSRINRWWLHVRKLETNCNH